MVPYPLGYMQPATKGKGSMPKMPQKQPGRPNVLQTDTFQLTDEAADAIGARLHRIEGQVRAIARMIDERQDCHAIANQFSAAKAALERACVQFMTAQMAECMRNGGATLDGRELERITTTFIKMLA